MHFWNLCACPYKKEELDIVSLPLSTFSFLLHHVISIHHSDSFSLRTNFIVTIFTFNCSSTIMCHHSFWYDSSELDLDVNCCLFFSTFLFVCMSKGTFTNNYLVTIVLPWMRVSYIFLNEISKQNSWQLSNVCHKIANNFWLVRRS